MIFHIIEEALRLLVKWLEVCGVDINLIGYINMADKNFLKTDMFKDIRKLINIID